MLTMLGAVAWHLQDLTKSQTKYNRMFPEKDQFFHISWHLYYMYWRKDGSISFRPQNWGNINLNPTPSISSQNVAANSAGKQVTLAGLFKVVI